MGAVKQRKGSITQLQALVVWARLMRCRPTTLQEDAVEALCQCGPRGTGSSGSGSCRVCVSMAGCTRPSPLPVLWHACEQPCISTKTLCHQFLDALCLPHIAVCSKKRSIDSIIANVANDLTKLRSTHLGDFSTGFQMRGGH